MATKEFEGKHDTFVVECSCGESLNVERIDRPALSGTRIECSECGDTGIVYEDGGIYKMAGANELEIKVKTEDD